MRTIGFEAYMLLINPNYGNNAIPATGTDPVLIHYDTVPNNNILYLDLKVIAAATDASNTAIINVHISVKNIDGTLSLINQPSYILNQKTDNNIALNITPEDDKINVYFIGLRDKTFNIEKVVITRAIVKS